MQAFNTKDPAFIAYAVTVLVMALHMVLLDAYSGVVRTRTKTVVNPEDAKTVAKGAELVEGDPAAVARVLRAHRNLLANGVPFLFLGLVWLFFAPTFLWAAVVFGTFVVARLLHSISYVNEAQPWRTLFFIIGQIAMVAVVVQIIRGLAG
jgi:glutathione S-transferase